MKDLTSIIELIKERVTLKEILVSKRCITGSLSEEQFSCLFHGADRKKSCRYYEETDTAYCWVCKDKWDVISFSQKLEEMTFPQTINYLIKTYRIDVSKLPDAPEAEIIRIKNREVVKVDDRKLKIEKISGVISSVRDELPTNTYTKLVYTFMMLKYAVSEDKFQKNFDQFKEAMLRVFKKEHHKTETI